MDLEQFAAEVVGIPVPFKEQGRDRAGIDCWGLVVLAYREVYGIELPDLGEHYDHKVLPTLAEVVLHERREHWLEVDKPQPGDVVVLRILKLPVHCGIIMAGGWLLHVHEGIDTCAQRFPGLMWENRIDGYFRHADRA